MATPQQFIKPSPKTWNERHVARFWRHVAKSNDAAACWLWKKSLTPYGYGQFAVFQNHVSLYVYNAHRVAYELTYGDIPDGLFVCHKCDVRACVRPDHLFVGTHGDNMRDMVAKGRHRQGKRVRRILMPFCKHGHARTPENTYTTPAGVSVCKVCSHERSKAWSERRRVSRSEPTAFQSVFDIVGLIAGTKSKAR